MKDYDFRGIINSIKEASPSHLALVSLVVFPIILKFWVESFEVLFKGTCVSWKVPLMVSITILYVLCMIWIVIENKKKNELRITRDKILTRLVSNNWKSMSFESAKKVLGDDYPNEKIVATIEEFSRSLRHVRLKDKDSNGVHKKDEKGDYLYKPGVGRISQID